MILIGEILVSLAIVIGGFFILVGSYGLCKLNAPMSRLHAPTKASTLGVGSILLASMILALVQGTPSLSELLIMSFLFVTAPVTGYFLSKVVIYRGQNIQVLPPLPADSNWSTRT
jgi:multicomponent K+:H+ antiporter subunit G